MLCLQFNALDSRITRCHLEHCLFQSELLLLCSAALPSLSSFCFCCSVAFGLKAFGNSTSFFSLLLFCSLPAPPVSAVSAVRRPPVVDPSDPPKPTQCQFHLTQCQCLPPNHTQCQFHGFPPNGVCSPPSVTARAYFADLVQAQEGNREWRYAGQCQPTIFGIDPCLSTAASLF